MVYFQPADLLKSIYGTCRELSIAWLYPQFNLVNNPSDRLRRFQISRYLDSLPYVHSDNFFNYLRDPSFKREVLLNYDFIVIFSISEYDRDLCEFLITNNKKVIFDHCENIFGLDQEDPIMIRCSAITCCSRVLANLTDNYLHNKGYDKEIFVIRDPIDDSTIDLSVLRAAQQNRALIMGMGANVQYVLPMLESACKETGYTIQIISEPEYRTNKHSFEAWSPYTWIKTAMDCSVALCWHDVKSFAAKGNVKVTLPMSLGLSVIASPVDSYQEAIEHGGTGFIAEDYKKIVYYLEVLKNPLIRFRIGLKARQSALANYSTEKIGMDYLSILLKLIVHI